MQRRAGQAPPPKAHQSGEAGLGTEGKVSAKLWAWPKANREPRHFICIMRICFSAVQTVGPCSLLVDSMHVQPLLSFVTLPEPIPEPHCPRSRHLHVVPPPKHLLGEASCTGFHFRAFLQFLCLPQFSPVEMHLYLISVSASLSHLPVILTGPALTCAGSGCTVHYGPSQHWSFHKDRQSEEQSRPWRARKTDVQCRPKRTASVCGGDSSELVQRDEPTFTQPSLLYFNKVLLNTYYGPMPFQVLGTQQRISKKDPDIMEFIVQ